MTSSRSFLATSSTAMTVIAGDRGSASCARRSSLSVLVGLDTSESPLEAPPAERCARGEPASPCRTRRSG
eukprot:14460531-Heterocapsa_arctica.AAC.1